MMKTKEYYVNNLNVLYEDNHLIVVEKPIDVLSQKDITNDFDMNEIIKDYLKVKYNKPGNVYLGLVHRLDRRVGGVMVFAKTSKAASRLSENIRNKEFHKLYLAKVRGILEKSSSINIKIKKDDNNYAIVCDDGKDSRLDYIVLGYDNNDTFVLVNLHTGRYNQIRASFNHINHPIINDYKYSHDQKNNESLALFCYAISIIHPVTKEKLIFTLLPHGDLWEGIDKYINDEYTLRYL